MTAASWALLGAAGALAAADWAAVATARRRVEYLCKPAVIVLLAACVVTLDPVDGLRRAYILTGLSFALAGDVLLMLPEPPAIDPRTAHLPQARQRISLFPLGLGAFLLTLIDDTAAFRTGGGGLASIGVAALIVLAVAVPIGTRVVGALAARGERTLRAPVIVYMAVLVAMVSASIASGNLAAAAGGWFFLASDATLVWNRFVTPLRWAPLAVAVTYHLAQGLITFSLVH